MDTKLVRRPHASICRFFPVERADAGMIRAIRLANWPLKHTMLKALLLFLTQTQTLLPGYPFIYTKIYESMIYRRLRIPSCHMKPVDLMEG